MATDGGSNGLFITFEGGEGSGKSAVCQRVFRHIGEDGRDCWRGKEPGCTQLGAIWRQQLLSPQFSMSPETEMFLFFADRAQNFDENIAPRLASGDIVVLDRHRDSTAAYQGAKGFCLDLISHCNDIATRGRRPDKTILLDIDSKDGLSRCTRLEFGEADRWESLDLEFHERVRGIFLSLASTEPERFVVIDASSPLDAIVDEVCRVVDNIIEERL